MKLKQIIFSISLLFFATINTAFTRGQTSVDKRMTCNFVINRDLIAWVNKTSYKDKTLYYHVGADALPANENKVLNPPHQVWIEDPTPQKIKKLFATVPDSVKNCPDSVDVGFGFMTDDRLPCTQFKPNRIIVPLKNGKGELKFNVVLRSERHIFNTNPRKMVYAIGTIYIDWIHPEKNRIKVKFKERKPIRVEDTMEWLYRQ